MSGSHHGSSLHRRRLMAIAGSAAIAGPRTLSAQQTAPVVGFRGNRPRRGPGRAIEHSWTENQTGRLPALAEDLVRCNVDLIFAGGPSRLLGLAIPTTLLARADEVIA